MSEDELEQQILNLGTAQIVILGAVCNALAKARAIDPGPFMAHLASVRAEWIARTPGKPGLSESLMMDLMTYLEIQAGFPPAPASSG